MKKSDRRELIICIAIPLLAGAFSAFIAGDFRQMYELVKKPPLSPPGWLFPIVWTILYIFMGIVSYILYSENSAQGKTALKIYTLSLAVNVLWPVIFFTFGRYFAAFVWLVFLWFLIWLLITETAKISKKASYLLYPYLAWLTFAGYLNLGIVFLNR